MTLLLGTDEAGYGPNLGPLVVGLTAWRIPPDCSPKQIAHRLRGCITDHECLDDPKRVPIADSKQLYQPARGLSILEQAVLAAWYVAGIEVRQAADVWPVFASCAEDIPPWHLTWDHDLPIIPCETPLHHGWRECLGRGLAKGQVSLAKVNARLMQPAEFNRLVQLCGSKGSVLSETTLFLVRDALASLPAELKAEGVLIVCDKHGGRDKYAAILQFVFPDHRLEVLREGRLESAYLLREGDERLEFRFRTNGEELLPTALASMTAKYLRELAMLAFNAFWQLHVPGVRPTAGYPGDATRFRDEIATAQAKLAIPDEQLWRSR